jgi:hypothetical protein
VGSASGPRFRLSVPYQFRRQSIVTQQPELAIGRGDASPARRVLLTDMTGAAPDQDLCAGCFEQQGVAALFHRIRCTGTG